MKDIDKEVYNFWLDRVLMEMVRQARLDLNHRNRIIAENARYFLEYLGADPDCIRALETNQPQKIAELL